MKTMLDFDLHSICDVSVFHYCRFSSEAKAYDFGGYWSCTMQMKSLVIVISLHWLRYLFPFCRFHFKGSRSSDKGGVFRGCFYNAESKSSCGPLFPDVDLHCIYNSCFDIAELLLMRYFAESFWLWFDNVTWNKRETNENSHGIGSTSSEKRLFLMFQFECLAPTPRETNWALLTSQQRELVWNCCHR